jgi:hypothetical protein
MFAQFIQANRFLVKQFSRFFRNPIAGILNVELLNHTTGFGRNVFIHRQKSSPKSPATNRLN